MWLLFSSCKQAVEPAPSGEQASLAHEDYELYRMQMSDVSAEFLCAWESPTKKKHF